MGRARSARTLGGKRGGQSALPLLWPACSDKIGEQRLPARFAAIPEMFGVALHGQQVVIAGCLKRLDNTIGSVGYWAQAGGERFNRLMVHRVAPDLFSRQDRRQP